MANPLDTLKKMKGKSWTELRMRGEQMIAARTDQIGLSGKLPTDEEFFALIDDSYFGGETPTATDLFVKFYEDAEYSFFPSFRQKAQTLETSRTLFGAESEQKILEKAEKIVAGKFDLLGFENLDFGAEIDWHYEPLSGKRSPLKHWKQFDELDAEETGDKKIVWELNRQQYFFNLGAAFWLTGDERFAECFVHHLESWMKQNQPGIGVNWVSSLEVSFRVISWIWAFNFFKEAAIFTPEIFQNALKFVYLHGRHLEKYLSTYYSPNTHLTGEALGLYYLGTQFPFFKAAKNWRETGTRILFAELDRQILNDGVYFEQSTWYQRYTADFYTHFFILKTLNGAAGDKDLQTKLDEKLQSLTDFLMFATRPDGTTPIIGDDDGGRLLPHSNGKSDDFRAVLSTNAVLFERGDYKFVAGDLAEETLWLLGTAGKHSFENLPAYQPDKNSAAFENGGYFVMRDGWAKSSNFLLVDCGAVGALSGGHGHADALAIDLAVGGRTVLVDAGTYSYHESAEMRDYFRASEAHNTLTIDDASQSEANGKFSWKTKANAQLQKWISQPRFDFFEGSHDGYLRLDAPATHTRSILFLKNDYWILRDFVETSGTHDYQLNFHFDAGANPAIETAENGAVFVNDAASNARFFTFGDNGEWRQKTSSISNLYGRKIDAPHLQFASSGAGAQEFFTFILPHDAGENAPEVQEIEVSGGRAFVVSFRGYQDLFVFADGEQIVRTEIFNTNFRFLWARLSAGEKLPEEFVMLGGTHFSLDGREIVHQTHELEFAAARRVANKLNVNTSENAFSISLRRKYSTTYILKNQD
ncbi:MAG: heparinase II/III family protein [Pyrinomonadaceae bacterium]|nr:heparinase II/III family protein [Pyrinomonadaceae bacterium]